MTTLAWLIVALWLGYCAGRLVAAHKYGGWIDRVSRRNADLEHRLENMLEWDDEQSVRLTELQMYDRNH